MFLHPQTCPLVLKRNIMTKILQTLHPCLDHSRNEYSWFERARESCPGPASGLYMCFLNYFIKEIKRRLSPNGLLSPKPRCHIKAPGAGRRGASQLYLGRGFLPISISRKRNWITIIFKTRGFTSPKGPTKTLYILLHHRPYFSASPCASGVCPRRGGFCIPAGSPINPAVPDPVNPEGFSLQKDPLSLKIPPHAEGEDQLLLALSSRGTRDGCCLFVCLLNFGQFLLQSSLGAISAPAKLGF